MSSQYHKIQTVFKRNPETKHKTLLLGQYSLPEFEYLKDNKWVFTEKVDGTNIRVMLNDGHLMFGGKTNRAQIPPKLVDWLRLNFNPYKELMRIKFPDGVCLYGEGYGAGIQKGGGNYGSQQKFVLFDVKIGKWWLHRDGVSEVADYLKMDIVPILGTGTLYDLVDFVSTGFNSQWGDFPAEGVVARPAQELCTRGGDRIITKLKHKDFT